MPKSFILTSPEGKQFKVTPPEGATQEQIDAQILKITGGPQKPPAMSTAPDIEAEVRAQAQKAMAGEKSFMEGKEAAADTAGIMFALGSGLATGKGIPSLGGKAIPMTPGAQAAVQIPVQGVLNAGGEAVKQLTSLALGLPSAPKTSGEAFGRIKGQFLGGAAMQGGSEVVAGGMRKLFQPAAKAMLNPDNIEVFRVADAYDLPLTAAEVTNGRLQRVLQNFADSSALGRGPAVARRKEINTRVAAALDDVVKRFSSVDASDTYGMGKALSSATDDARRAWKGVADAKYDEIRSKIPQGITVSLTDAYKKAQELLGRSGGLAEKMPNFLKDLGPEDEILKKFISDAATEIKTPTGQTITAVKRLSPDEALALRSKLSEKAWQYTRQGDRQAARIVSDMEKVVDESLTRQLGNVVPQFKEELGKAKAFYRDGADLFHDAVIADLANRDMQRVVEGIGLDQTAKITDLKRAFTTYGKGEEGWQAFRAHYTNEIIRKAGDDPAKMKSIIDGINPTALDAVYGGGSVRGAQALKTMRELATAADRVNKITGDGNAKMLTSLSMLMWGAAGSHPALATAGAAGILGPPIMSRIINNPKAAKLYIQGWTQAPKNMGVGMTNMVRAIDLAITAKEANQLFTLAEQANQQASGAGGNPDGNVQRGPAQTVPSH